VTAASEDGTPRAERSAAERRGRVLGIVVFWSLAVFVVGMSALSIIPTLYFPAVAPKPDPVSTRACASRLDALERELVQRSAEQLRTRDDTHPPRWLTAWDDEMARLTGTCGELEPVRKDIAEARHRLGRMLEGYATDIALPQRRARQALDDVLPANTPSAGGDATHKPAPPG